MRRYNERGQELCDGDCEPCEQHRGILAKCSRPLGHNGQCLCEYEGLPAYGPDAE